MSELADFVEKYLGLGLALIPVRPGSKVPLVKWKGFAEYGPTGAQVYEWLKKLPAANIAALMGRPSGNILAVDVDFRNGGEASMKNLDLPETFTSRTGGGGYHFFYQSRASYQKRIGVFPGIDLIADGGYCVLPPSLHNSGGRYEIQKDIPIKPAPDWLTKFLIPAAAPETRGFAHHSLIPVGNRHESIKRSIVGYAKECLYLTQLWKRSFALVVKCCEASESDPFTVGELFNICLWSWNKTHQNEQFSYRQAWKLLDGSARKWGKIQFAAPHTPLHTFLLNNSKQHHNISDTNTSTTQSDSVSETDIYKQRSPGGDPVWKKG